MRRFEPYLVALLAGVLAILGAYFASGQAYQTERELREEQREADTRAAARVLDLEVFNRLRLTLNAFGVANPTGDIKVPSGRAQWGCVIDALDAQLVVRRPEPQAACVRPAQPAAAGTPLEPLGWSLADRHLLAARIDGGEWFTITTAADAWATISDNHGTLGRLVRRARASPETARSVLEAVRRLARARFALTEHVRMDS